MKRIFWFLLLLGLVACAPQTVIDSAELGATQAAGGLPAGEFLQGSVRQWAVEATASSEYADPEWAAVQATGAPDTFRCGDYQTAWASVGSDTVEWLELKYAVPVFVTGVRVIQTFNPNQVARVELLGEGGRVRQIYKADPEPVDQPCPFELLIPVERTRAKYDTVRITVDQSVVGLGWNEIDAVELVGDE